MKFKLIKSSGVRQIPILQHDYVPFTTTISSTGMSIPQETIDWKAIYNTVTASKTYDNTSSQYLIRSYDSTTS